MTYLISPTERPPFSLLGPSSSLPEQLGVDCIWQSPHGLCGVQRKALSDLISSVRDSRLGKELAQMATLHTAMVIIEGQATWTADGQLLSKHTQWSIRQQHGVEWSIQSKGVMVCWTRTPTETVAAVEHLYERTQREEHTSSLLARPNAQKNGWGRLSDKDTAIHFLSGIQGLSTELATRIYDQFGRVPLKWDVTEEELASVRGIGPKRVASLLKVLS